MMNIPAPIHAREEWTDADFDLSEGDVLSPPQDTDSDKGEDEDWDVEMDLGKTGGAKLAMPSVRSLTPKHISLSKGAMVTIRPGSVTPSGNIPTSPEVDDDDEGIATIKISGFPKVLQSFPEDKSPADEDLEADFALPADLTQLSLRPLSLHHRNSKASLEWGDRDHTSSSASSDAYSSLGFNYAASPSSNSTSASLAGTDDDCDDEEGDLEGLIIPTGLFETDQGRQRLAKVLDMKRKSLTSEERVKATSSDPEEDFEIGLVINGDDDLSPTKIVQRQQTRWSGAASVRSSSVPPRPITAQRPPSRLRAETPSGSNQPVRSSVSPPLRSLRHKRSQNFQAPSNLPSPVGPPPPLPSSKQSFIRNQKSHGVLKSSAPSHSRRLSRKASLSALLETSNAQASPTTSESNSTQSRGGYSAATASSRARMHSNSISRAQAGECQAPTSRPTTPSTNPAPSRLTMPSMTRLKSRPSINSVFPQAEVPNSSQPVPNESSGTSKLPPKSSASSVQPTRVIRRTKKRVFGDGTELDNFEDLPTDRDKEAQFRVQPKGTQSRTVSGSTSKSNENKDTGRGTIRRKKEKDLTSNDDRRSLCNQRTVEPQREHAPHVTAPSNSLKHKQSRIEALSKNENPQKRRPSFSGNARRKPTLIRNLGGAGSPKVVGEMRWNPQTLRWEGNDQALREFETAGASVRPALITHLTGSTIGSPPGSFGAAARVVGNMVFDPVRMCWQSTLPPEEDEPDVFAELADDEEESDWAMKGGTIRASHQPIVVRLSTATDSRSESSSHRTPSPVSSTYSRERTFSQSDSERGSRASITFDIGDDFVDQCIAAERRHREEMNGWTVGSGDFGFDASVDRSSLYEVRVLATRQY